MKVSEHLHNAEQLLHHDIPSVPESLAAFYKPKDPENITHEDVQHMLEASLKTMQWGEQNIQPLIENAEASYQQMQQANAAMCRLERRIERLESITIMVSDAISLVIEKTRALLVDTKTKAVLVVVSFRDPSWQDYVRSCMPSMRRTLVAASIIAGAIFICCNATPQGIRV